MLYRIIKSGNNKRREYLGLNRSPLFQDLPQKDFAEEQKLSFDNFLHSDLKKIFATYFPAEFSNYNNHIRCEVKEIRCEEPKNTEDETRANGLT
jgi:DNA-directed RNA polymerase beta subunit